MTIREVCAQLRAECKPYALIRMSRFTYSKTLSRIESGAAKDKTVKSFFNKFGYTGQWNDWTKQESK